jgi:GST-like protein
MSTLPYRVNKVDIRRGEQFAPDFLRISPNNKIPAIVDHDADGQSVFESGAILVYLAEKTGRLLPASGKGRVATFEWLFFQVGGTGPMLGQAHHFRVYAPDKIPYAIDRYTNEAKRLFGVLDRRLATVPFLAGDEFTIADIANYPWLLGYGRLDIDMASYPHLAAWMDRMKARPAVVAGLAVPPSTNAPMDERAREVLFGKTQHGQG